MKEQFCMVLTTTDCQEFAQKKIDAVLEQRLAACIQTIPIQSSYWWDGQVHSDNELPEIIHMPITKGFDPYLAWLDETTRN